MPKLVKYKITFWGLDTDKMVKPTNYNPLVSIKLKDSSNVQIAEEDYIRNFEIT